MSASLYDDRSSEPSREMLLSDLKRTGIYFERICQLIEDEYGSLRLEWKYYSKKTGWLLKLFHKKRNVLFVIPMNSNFRVAFTFGDKATEIILASELEAALKDLLREARRYVEGRTIQLDVTSEKDCAQVIELIRIKLSS